MTLKGGTSQACAACKYQRRKCHSECPLAPYFPPDQPKKFQNAHKLFGVSNILRILKNLDAAQKQEAMRSIIYQANIRDRFPVHGCWHVICQLRYQIWQAEEELHDVQSQLEVCRQQNNQQDQITTLTDDMSQLELCMAPPSHALPLFTNSTQPYNPVYAALPISQQISYSNSCSAGYSSGYFDPKENLGNSLWVQNGNTNSIGVQSQLVASLPLTIQHEVVQDYDEIHPLFDPIDDRQSYIDSKEAYESSAEESMKDTTQSIEHVPDNELKSAAACFSLTSVN